MTQEWNLEIKLMFNDQSLWPIVTTIFESWSVGLTSAVKLIVTETRLIKIRCSNCEAIFQSSNRYIRTMCEICTKLMVKPAQQHRWRGHGVFIVKLEQISYIVKMFLLLTLTNKCRLGIGKRTSIQINFFAITKKWIRALSQLTYTCSKSTIETLEKVVKHVCKLTIFLA